MASWLNGGVEGAGGETWPNHIKYPETENSRCLSERGHGRDSSAVHLMGRANVPVWCAHGLSLAVEV